MKLPQAFLGEFIWSLELLFNKIADLALEKLDPELREKRRQERSAKGTKLPIFLPPAPAVKPSTRYIPRRLRDQIWLRDEGKCQFQDFQTGKICGSSQSLALDHRFPYALGGEHSNNNLRLLCEKHNNWRAGMLFGRKFNPIDEP